MSTENRRPVESLNGYDFETNPVWEYVNLEEGAESVVRRAEFPVATLANKVVGTQVRLANGTTKWALVGNVDVTSVSVTEQFITMSIEHDGEWFKLARYHDFDYAERGPDALARFLRMPVDEVFPISYDLRPFANGEPTTLVGAVPKEPKHRLSRTEILALAIP